MTSSSVVNVRWGIICMMLAIFMYATVNAVVKDVMGSYPLMQIIFLRFSLALIPCAFMIYQSGGLHTLKTNNLKSHFFCGCMAVLNLTMLFTSFKQLPLADANAICFSTIFFVTLMSYPILKERVGFHRWLAVILGFAGILVMANPSGELFNYSALMCLIFAFGDGVLMIFARLLSRTNHSSTIVFYCSLFAASIALCFMPFVWITPSFTDFLKLAFLGVGAGTAQILLTYAYRYAQATQVAPVIYTSILWSTMYGYFIWGEVPSHEAMLGGLLIICAGLYLIYHETRAQSAPAQD
ncbi:MAG: DMT family transporter [Janthinobacterium lividum]